jgi:WD40 repeat protein
MRLVRFCQWSSIVALCACLAVRTSADEPKPAGPATNVSYYQQIRPIFQAHCQGCHQPAKPSGKYVMTAFDRMLAAGESGESAIVPGKPDESYLVEQITPVNGQAKMPRGKKALTDAEVELVKRWIVEGAKDDTPVSARNVFDMDHPPIYTRPPVITSIDFSPDGTLLAVAGFHEVLLVKPDGSGLVARLVGMAERIESVRFSPDGKQLVVGGGLPARMGEIQIWDVENRKLKLSVPVTFDTIYGANWSPDAKLISFGCSDNTVRAINAETGEQVLYQGAHADWVRDTVFSTDGSHLVSVARDMTTKLTEVATQRFIDNVTSITPGALKGGIQSVARHPTRDEIVVGGSDSVVKVYRMYRLSNRAIGDDGNLIRQMPAMTGRIWSVAVSRDGRRIAAGSSLDGAGEVAVFGYEFDTSLPEDIKNINQKVVTTRSAEEKAALEKYHTDGVRQISKTDVPNAGVYAVAFRPDGQVVAASSADGKIRMIDPDTGYVLGEFSPAPVSQGGDVAKQAATPATQSAALGARNAAANDASAAAETLPPGTKLVAIEVTPPTIELGGRFDYAQLVVFGRLNTGDRVDLTRMAKADISPAIVAMSPAGLVRPRAEGLAKLRLRVEDQSVTVPVVVTGFNVTSVGFVRDVNPVLSRLGCNAGTCHGAAKGKNGFKLSLRGYDPIFDVRAFTDDLASRRVNVASPDDSMMLEKPTAAVPHVGGGVMQRGDPYYDVIRQWIAGGATLDLKTPRVARIELFPANPIVQQLGARQQMRVLATYADSSVRDVTQEAFIESSNSDVATAARGGLMSAARRGEAAVLARFEGAYAATTLTVMGDRSGFVWEQPPTWGRIDELVAKKWERMKIRPSDLCGDAEFMRRVYLDLTGLPPTADEVRAFMADARDTRVKRDELVDKLVGGESYVDYWTNKWADLLQVNRKFLGPEGAATFRQWIRGEVAANTPYDQFAKKVLTASGSNRENPAASYFKILREPATTMENTTHLFLGVRFNCNKCHDHPFERWTQDQYYHLAAFFARTDLERDPASGDRNIGGTAVEGAKPLYEIVVDKKDGEVLHDRTGQITAPQFPYDCNYQPGEQPTRRQQLAAWITSAENQYFARSYVNRLWGYLFGVGIIEPIDDIRAGNPASNPELLDYLTAEFVRTGFDARHVVRLVAKSRAYQLSVATNQWNDDDKLNYSHATARRLPAEVLYDAVHRVTGSVSQFPGVPAGTRAAALPDSGVELPSGFLNKLGRPPRESACECERSSGLQLGPVMALISGPTISDAIADAKNDLAKLVGAEADDRKLVSEVFLRLLNRPASDAEIDATLKSMADVDGDHAKLVEFQKQREAEYAPIHAQKEKDREAAITATKSELDAYEKELVPRREQMEKERIERLAKAEAELKKHEESLAPKLAEWEKQQSPGTAWTIVEPRDLKANTGAKLTKEDDGSIIAERKDGPSVYTVVADTNLTGITGVQLEALADDRLPGRGPGLADNGNFVLTEFDVKVNPKGKPQERKEVKLEAAEADFNQGGFDVKTAIDDQRPAQNNGWAVFGQTGASHWAKFEIKEPVGFEGGTVLVFTLDQRYVDRKHSLGRFRLWVTTAVKPIALGLPAEISTVLAAPADQRTDQQKTTLLRHFAGKDEQWRKMSQAVAEAKKPLAPDAKLEEIKGRLAAVSQPVQTDPRIVQLRGDVEMSTQQQANKRLTMVQDLAWALINSPAFLFNH